MHSKKSTKSDVLNWKTLQVAGAYAAVLVHHWKHRKKESLVCLALQKDRTALVARWSRGCVVTQFETLLIVLFAEHIYWYQDYRMVGLAWSFYCFRPHRLGRQGRLWCVRTWRTESHLPGANTGDPMHDKGHAKNTWQTKADQDSRDSLDLLKHPPETKICLSAVYYIMPFISSSDINRVLSKTIILWRKST